jgi:hypothetical protein
MAVRDPIIFERTHGGQYRGLFVEDLLLVLLQLALLYLPLCLAPAFTARALNGTLLAFLENAQLCVLALLLPRLPLNIAARYLVSPRMHARGDNLFGRLLTRDMLVPLLTLPLPLAALFAVFGKGDAMHGLMSVAMIAASVLLTLLYVLSQARLWAHNGIVAAFLRGPGRQLLPRLLWTVGAYLLTALLLTLGSHFLIR